MLSFVFVNIINAITIKLIELLCVLMGKGSLTTFATGEDIVPDSELVRAISQPRGHWRQMVTLT